MDNQISKRVLDILEWPVIQEKLKSYCFTSTGKVKVDDLVPLSEKNAGIQLKKISVIKELQSLGEFISISGVTDIEPLLVRAKKESVLTLEELASIKNFIVSSNRVRNFLKEQKEQHDILNSEYLKYEKLDKIGDLLISSITDNNELNEKKYTDLKKIKDSLFTTKKEIEKNIQRLISSPNMGKILQEKIYKTHGQRYVILIKSNMKGKTKGTVHDISSSGATLYFEPDEVRELNDKIIMLEVDLNREINRILQILSFEAGENSESLLNNLEAVSYMDFLSASAKFSSAINASEPEISEKPIIKLFHARHPLLYLMDPKKVISNNIELGTDYNSLIISGANTGGKTVLLKTIGLAVLFAMFGLHIPAKPDSKIGIFTNILADIGDDQNLAQSLSTFSGQIVIINEMLKMADSHTLVLIDEIIVGTNPRQGAALAQAILEELANTNSKVVVTTHYSELKELASTDKRFMNSSVSFDMDTLKPTYMLITGIPGVSYAIEIAQNYGLPQDVQSRSKELLDSREISVESLLEQLQKYKQEIEEEKIHISQLEEELSAEKTDYKTKQKKLDNLREDIKKERGIEFLEKLKEYRNHVSGRITDIQQASSREADKIQKEIIKIQEEVSTTLQKETRSKFSEAYMPVDPDKINPGDKVFISSLEKEGKIESIDSSGKSAQILFGSSIRSRFKMEELLTSGSSSGSPVKNNPQKKKKSYDPVPQQGISVTIQTSYNTIDLRGKRVDEAIMHMEQNLDRMSASGISAAIIIHGHGTGALKEAVRENLKYSIYASDFRHGKDGEGSDGVTVVKLR